jgi:hypothetical protein
MGNSSKRSDERRSDVVMVFPLPADIISMNEAGSFGRRRKEQAWRDAAYFYYCAEFPGIGPKGRALPPSEVHTVLPVTTQRRRDPINFAKTVKHVVDGITMAGAWPDDTPDYVTQHVPSLKLFTNGATPLVVVRITPRSVLHGDSSDQ